MFKTTKYKYEYAVDDSHYEVYVEDDMVKMYGFGDTGDGLNVDQFDKAEALALADAIRSLAETLK